MSILLRLLQLEDLKSLREQLALHDLKIEEGALPPPFIVDAAIADLSAGKEPLWSSFFLFVHEPDRTVVGSGGFRGLPTNGRVEIGYGMAPSHQGKGIATSGARLMADLAFDHSEVREVYAETAVDNPASRRVVEKAGFTHVGQRMSDEDGMVDCWLKARS